MRGSVKSKAVLIVGSLVLASLGFTSVASAAPDDPVSFTDANLQACVNSRLDQGAADPVTEAQLGGLAILYCTSWSITSLEGLQHATDLQTLALENNQVSDLGPLANLTDLQTLLLGINEVSDLGPLANLTGLQNLYLHGNQVSDLNPLSDLPALRNLDLGGNQVSELGPLANLTSLQTLFLHGNRIVDVSPLAGLTGLGGSGDLTLSSQRVSVDPAYVGMPVANPLRDMNGDVISVMPGSYCYDGSCAELVYPSAGSAVEVTWNQDVTIGTESVLFSGTLTREVLASSAPTLTGTPDAGTVGGSYSYAFTVTGAPAPTVTLTDGDLPDGLSLSGGGVLAGTPTAPGTYTFTVTASNGVDPAATLPVTLTINPAPVYVDFEDANLLACVNDELGQGSADGVTEDQLRGVYELYCSDQNVVKLGGLQYATSLEDLYLDGNQIEDLGPLAGLSSLGFLALEDNQIADVSALAGLSGLYYLGLSENLIADFEPLKNLVDLQALGLDDNLISDISPLEGLVRLEILVLDYNQVEDISVLEHLTSLTNLTVTGNQVTDISPLAGLGDLDYLELHDQRVTDPPTFVGLPSPNPVRDAAGNVVTVDPTSYCAGAGCELLVYPTAGAAVEVTWNQNVTIGTASAEFSGALVREVIDLPPPTVSGIPDAGTVGEEYSYKFTVTGVPTPTVGVTDGALPDGLTLSADGTISGTPTKAGTYEFTVTATNQAATTRASIPGAVLETSITIKEPTTPITPVTPVTPKKPGIANSGATQILPIIIGGIVLLAGGLFLTYRTTRKK